MSTQTVNPFSILQLQIQSQLYLNLKTPTFNDQLFFLSGLLAISFISILISLGIRIKASSFWIFRKTTTSAGVFISPNPIISWLLCAAIFIPLLEVYVVQAFFYAKPGSNLLNIMIWRNVIWLPLFIGAWFLTWATVLAPILSKAPSIEKTFEIGNYPIVLNIFFISVPILLIAVILPLSLITNSKFNFIFTNATTLLNEVEVLAKQFQDGSVASDVLEMKLLGLLQIIEGVVGEVKVLVISWRRIWISWSVFTSFFLIIYIFAAFTYSRSLNKSISKLRSRVRNGDPDAFSSQLTSLLWTYRALIFTEVSIGCIGIGYLAMSVTISFKIVEIARGGLIAELITLGAIYIFASLGTLSCLAILFRSFSTMSTKATSTYHSTTQRSNQSKSMAPVTSFPLTFKTTKSGHENEGPILPPKDAVTRFQLHYQLRSIERMESLELEREREREFDEKIGTSKEVKFVGGNGRVGFI